MSFNVSVFVCTRGEIVFFKFKTVKALSTSRCFFTVVCECTPPAAGHVLVSRQSWLVVSAAVKEMLQVFVQAAVMGGEGEGGV